MPKSLHDAAYGDFQTPLALANAVCRLLVQRGLRPASVVEPTCGTGSFLLAAAEAFPEAALSGQDIDPAHARASRSALGRRARVRVGDVFRTAWTDVLAREPAPILVLGNPPWVTNAELSVLGVSNLPSKWNLKSLSGLAAMTGASNFDVSEWLLLRLLALGQGRDVTVAMLVKTTVARRVLVHAHAQGLALEQASLHRIDAQAAFGVAVDAGLFCFNTLLRPPAGRAPTAIRCEVFADLEATVPESEVAILDGRLVADARAYALAATVMGQADPPWRSGLKHDCAKVMELQREGTNLGNGLRNGLGEPVDVEPALVHPLLKSSDLRGEDRPTPRRWIVLPQRRLGEDTAALADTAPRTWRYLLAHASALDARRSSIYRSQPRFAVFGLGEYSFAPWKVAISGLYKRAAFTLVGPDAEGRPMLLDDTCYFLGFPDQASAVAACWLLRSAPAQSVVQALTFWDAKRPITKALLDHLDLRGLAGAALESGAPRALRPALRALAGR